MTNQGAKTATTRANQGSREMALDAQRGLMLEKSNGYEVLQKKLRISIHYGIKGNQEALFSCCTLQCSRGGFSTDKCRGYPAIQPNSRKKGHTKFWTMRGSGNDKII